MGCTIYHVTTKWFSVLVQTCDLPKPYTTDAGANASPRAVSAAGLQACMGGGKWDPIGISNKCAHFGITTPRLPFSPISDKFGRFATILALCTDCPGKSWKCFKGRQSMDPVSQQVLSLAPQDWRKHFFSRVNLKRHST